jgi:DNA-binding winged helix-turn-helix (wHTH) protein
MKLQHANLAVIEAAGITHNRELDFSAPPFEWSPSFDGADNSPRHEPITQLELDTYRIALVPNRGRRRSEGTSHSATGTIRKLLLLPLTWKEFVTHVRGEAGQPISTEKMHILEYADVRIDLLSMEVQRGDRPVVLTAMEFKVLKFLVMNPNRAISRDELLNQVWGYENYPCTRTVDNHVMKLRHKLEKDIARPVHFRTVHGVGYKFIPGGDVCKL